MTHLLALIRRLLCGHPTTTAQRLLVHPSGRQWLTYYRCRCEACGATWSEHA